MPHEQIKLLVTGAKGMLGRDLVPVLELVGYSVVYADIEEFDITSEKQTSEFINSSKPDVIIHCAAYTNVDKAEEDQEKAFLINETGTKHIANVSKDLNAKLICISTDYVFNGEKETPYNPDDPVAPINVYGLSKLKGEQAAQINPRTYIARTSWLYGFHGKNFVSTMINLARKNNELRVVDDQVGCPTWTVALSNALINIIETDKPYGIYHTCGSGSCSWYEFACEIFKLMDMDVKVQPVKTEEFSRLAKRPRNSIMNNSNICPDWKDSLKEFIKTYGDQL